MRGRRHFFFVESVGEDIFSSFVSSLANKPQHTDILIGNMAFQKFISEDGQRLPSLPKHPCDNSDDEYYLLWSDIKQTFEDINYLKNRTGERVLFMTDKEFKLYVFAGTFKDDEVHKTLAFQTRTLNCIVNLSIYCRCLPLRVRDSDSDAYTIINMSKKDVAARVVRMNVPRCNSHQDSKVGKSALDIPSVCRSYLQIYSLLGNTRNAMFDHRVEANLVYFYDTFLKMFENLGCLEDDRKQLLEEKTRIMVEEIQELHRNIRQKVYLAAGHRMLRNFIADSGLSKPRLFIVLPSDFGSWQDSDTTTHTFRLFFLCDPQASRDPQNEIIPRHMHFSNHPGYKVHQPQEFLRKYGEYILMLLETIKHGKIHKHDFLRQLDPGKTSTGRPYESCDLTSGRLGPLIDKTIAYILSLSPPRWSSKDPNLHPSETRDIKQYLDAEERNDVVGDLNRYCIGDRTRWVCLGHLSCYVQIDDLQKLAQFVRNQKGSINIQSGISKSVSLRNIRRGSFSTTSMTANTDLMSPSRLSGIYQGVFVSSCCRSCLMLKCSRWKCRASIVIPMGVSLVRTAPIYLMCAFPR